jgi:hypothetical protein
MDSRCTSEEIYDLLSEIFMRWSIANLDMYKRTELDGLLDVASRKIAARSEKGESLSESLS